MVYGRPVDGTEEDDPNREEAGKVPVHLYIERQSGTGDAIKVGPKHWQEDKRSTSPASTG